MQHHRLSIVSVDQDGWFTLRTRSPYGLEKEHALSVGSTEPSVEDLRQALLATGWVEPSGDEFLIRGEIGIETLKRFVQEMFSYFDAPGVPGQDLLRVKQAVDDRYLGSSTLAESLSPWVYAWLDLVVREDLAEEARAVDDVWTADRISVDAEKHCRRRIEQLLRRQAPEGVPSRRMAPSAREGIRGDRESRTG